MSATINELEKLKEIYILDPFGLKGYLIMLIRSTATKVFSQRIAFSRKTLKKIQLCQIISSETKFVRGSFHLKNIDSESSLYV